MRGATQRGGDGLPVLPEVGAPCSYRGWRSPCGRCPSRGCSCSRRPGRRRTCPACGWRRAPRHSRWAAGGEAESAAGSAPRPGPPGPPRFRWAAGGRRSETSGTCATTFNNLTFSRHADPAQVGELAGRAVAGGHHELPLAVHGGAVQVAGLAGDVYVVIWGDGASQDRGPGSGAPLSFPWRRRPPPPGAQRGPGEWEGLAGASGLECTMMLRALCLPPLPSWGAGAGPPGRRLSPLVAWAAGPGPPARAHGGKGQLIYSAASTPPDLRQDPSLWASLPICPPTVPRGWPLGSGSSQGWEPPTPHCAPARQPGPGTGVQGLPLVRPPVVHVGVEGDTLLLPEAPPVRRTLLGARRRGGGGRPGGTRRQRRFCPGPAGSGCRRGGLSALRLTGSLLGGAGTRGRTATVPQTVPRGSGGTLSCPCHPAPPAPQPPVCPRLEGLRRGPGQRGAPRTGSRSPSEPTSVQEDS